MRFDVVTLFPEIFAGFVDASFMGRARQAGKLDIRCRSPREFGLGRHRAVDDTPYGGGSGMVMRVDVMLAAMESLDADAPAGVKGARVLLTPQGVPFRQRDARRLAEQPAVMLICGRYEGFDERIRDFVDEEISLGDFVLTGGEVPAMAVMDACVRLLPGVLGNERSTHEESHSPETFGLLEYPQYTRPADFRGRLVPDVLASGNHKEIARWRTAMAVDRTKRRRPDLIATYERRVMEAALGQDGGQDGGQDDDAPNDAKP